MTRLGIVLITLLAVAGVVGQSPVAAQSDASGVTGAGEAIFSNGATFNGVQLHGLTVGQGIFIAPDGSARGQFQAVLLGTSLLGVPQDVIVEGTVSSGSVEANGSIAFNGTATVNMGDGTLPVPGVPFTATVSTSSLALILNATALPTATVTAGSITIQ
jgi:hypothetical protein